MNNDIEWKMVKLGDISIISSGGTPSTENSSFWGGNIPWMNSGELNLKIVNDVEGRITDTGLKCSSTHWIPARCVLIGLAGQGKTRGTAAYNTIPLCTNQSIAAIYPNDDIYNSKYLYYFFETQYEKLRELSSGGGGRGGLNKGHLQKYFIPIPYKNGTPDLETQSIIAQKLSDMDSLISAKEKLLAKKRNLKTAAMQKLIKDEESENWRKVKLKECGKFTKGSGISRSESNSGSIPAVRYGELYTKHNDYIKQFYSFISKEVADTAKRLTKGDILFTASGETKEDIGKSVAFLNDFEAFAGGDLIILSPFKDFDSQFMGFILNSEYVRKQKAETGQGDAVVHIRTAAVQNLYVLIPFTSDGKIDYEEQKRIASILSDMDSEITSIEKEITKFQNLKTAMMQKMFCFTKEDE
ncbi:MAG: restriction endonuclease subunit S [Treponema sp.]|nr:restriction endonuclease subunit S [Candidatus Treponema merdequi]